MVRERRTHNHGVSNPLRDFQRAVDRTCDVRRHDGLPDFRHSFLEEFAVFGLGNRRRVRAQQAYPVGLQEPFLVQLHCHSKAGLPAQRGKHTVGALLLDDAPDGFQRQRLQVNRVGHCLVGHNRGGVGVAQHDLHAGFFQDPTRLCPGVIEFGGLSDHNRAGADHQYLPDTLI